MSTGTVINIAAGSNFTKSSSPTFGQADSTSIPKPSKDYDRTSSGVINDEGAEHGRNKDLLATAFPASVLGLQSYDPQDVYNQLLSGDNTALALGADAASGVETYMGSAYGTTVGVKHLTYANAPDLSTVNRTDLNIPNPYTPDVTNRAADVADWEDDFNNKYSATSNAFPAAAGDPAEAFTGNTGLDLNARDTESSSTGLNPSATSSSRVGDWTSPTLGRWMNNG